GKGCLEGRVPAQGRECHRHREPFLVNRGGRWRQVTVRHTCTTSAVGSMTAVAIHGKARRAKSKPVFRGGGRSGSVRSAADTLAPRLERGTLSSTLVARSSTKVSNAVSMRAQRH